MFRFSGTTLPPREIALLPLALGAWTLAAVFTILNVAVLGWRIRVEDRALEPAATSPNS